MNARTPFVGQHLALGTPQLKDTTHCMSDTPDPETPQKDGADPSAKVTQDARADEAVSQEAVPRTDTPDAEEQATKPASKIWGIRDHKKRHHVHRFGLWFFSLILFLAVVSGVAVLALTGKDVVLPNAVSQHVERQINAQLSDAKVSVGQIVINVDDRFIPRMRARNVGIIDPTGSEIAHLNELQARFSFDQIKSGNLTPEVLRLVGAQVVVRRDREGQFAFDFGGDAGASGSVEDVLKAIDSAFSTKPMSDVKTVEATGITISLEDARSQRIWQATDAKLTLENAPETIDISLNFDVFNGTENLARTQATFTTQKGSLLTNVALSVDNVPALDLAQQSPALSFLSVLDAPISAAMRAKVNAQGQLSSYAGTLEIGSGQLVAEAGSKPLDFEGAKGYFDYDPSAERLTFAELSVRSEAFEFAGGGHMLLRDFNGNFPSKFIGQFNVDRLSADPRDVFEVPVEFDGGSVDLQLALDPFSVRVGQLALRREDLWLYARAEAEATAQGWAASVDARTSSIQAAELMAFWPEKTIPETRKWMVENIQSATYQDLALSVRLAPGAQVPQTHLGWSFEDAQVRFMNTMPLVSNAAGYGTIAGNAMTVVVQEGAISAPSGGDIDVANTVLHIPRLDVKPATLDVQLQTQSSVEAALSLMALKPFDVLKEAAFGPDVSQGQAQLTGQLSFPLKKVVQLEDVEFDVAGSMTNLSSSTLMAGQDLTSKRMTLALDPSGLSISGPVDVSGAKADVTWRKNFGPDHRGKSDISGQLTLNQDALDAFDISLPKNTVSGSAQGKVSVALRRGQDPAFTVTSALEGLGLSVPAIGFSKPKAQAGTLEVTGTAGDIPSVTNMVIEAPGLTASEGTVSLTSQGELDLLEFKTLKVGAWLDSSATLIGRGAGEPVGVLLRGGSLDLMRSPFGTGDETESDSSTRKGPIELNIDRLKVTDSYALYGLDAQLTQNGGLSGRFSGRLNSTAPVTGTVKAGKYGPTIMVTSNDAGKAVMAAGLLEKASGGDLTFSLVSKPEQGSYDGSVSIKGIKVQSAPRLAELLSLASGIGVLDQLSGPGISFAEILSSFEIEPDWITIKSSSAEGPSLGITSEGVYSTVSKEIDLQGVISPVYFLNAIGQLVSRKGEGLFGFNFTLKGAVNDPTIGVNPLSLLTPGALRGIFRGKTPSAPKN